MCSEGNRRFEAENTADNGIPLHACGDTAARFATINAVPVGKAPHLKLFQTTEEVAQATTLDSTVRYLGIEVDDALELAEQTEVRSAKAGRRWDAARP